MIDCTSNKSNYLLRGMLYVFLANIINMGFNLITNIILPRFLSVDSYAAIKTYQLYISYIGALHFGFIDGTYLRYGGKNLQSIGTPDLAKNIGTLRFFQIGVTIVSIVVSVIFQNTILLFFSLAIVPLNMANYFSSLYQATGEFNRYGRIINATAILNCCINIVLILIVQTDNYIYFLSSYILIDVFIWFYLEVFFRKNRHINYGSFSLTELISNCKSGFLLMLGNLSSFILTGLDRWFVKILMDTSAFAYYSFAVSMESFLNVAMNPVIITLYNYFCNNKKREQLLRVRNSIMIFASIIISAAFPAKFILEKFLPSYSKSTMVMFFLFATQLFNIVNKGIYINLYKAQRKQTEYFYKLVLVIISGVIFNIICYLIYPQKESFAFGTLLSSILWFYLNKTSFKTINYKITQYVYIFLNLIVFILCGYRLSSISGFILYLIYLLLSTFLFMHNDLLFLKEKLANLITQFKNKRC